MVNPPCWALSLILWCFELRCYRTWFPWAPSCFPRRQNHVDDFLDTSTMLDTGENGRTCVSHLPRVPVHDLERRSHILGDIDL